MNTSSKWPKPGDLNEDSDWNEKDWTFFDEPPCRYCGADLGEQHKHGCHLIKAIAEANEKNK